MVELRDYQRTTIESLVQSKESIIKKALIDQTKKNGGININICNHETVYYNGQPIVTVYPRDFQRGSDRIEMKYQLHSTERDENV